MTQSIVDPNEQSEDADWVYRASRPARAQIEKLNPEAGRWLQYPPSHGEEEGEPNERSAQLKALAWRSYLGATARAGSRKWHRGSLATVPDVDGGRRRDALDDCQHQPMPCSNPDRNPIEPP